MKSFGHACKQCVVFRSTAVEISFTMHMLVLHRDSLSCFPFTMYTSAQWLLFVLSCASSAIQDALLGLLKLCDLHVKMIAHFPEWCLSCTEAPCEWCKSHWWCPFFCVCINSRVFSVLRLFISGHWRLVADRHGQHHESNNLRFACRSSLQAPGASTHA